MLLHVKRDLSRAKTSNLLVPCPEGLAFDPYQKAAVEYAMHRSDTLIGDAPGLGKTIEAIGVANFFSSSPILVICPAYLKPNWEAEFNKWKTNAHTIKIVEDKKPTEFGTITIINYEILEPHGAKIRETEWDLLIVDESHRLKSGKADRTLQVFGGIKRDGNKKIIARYEPITAHRRLFLTGTPVKNGKPKELWPMLRAIDPDGLGKDWFWFAKRYCDLVELTRFDMAKSKDVRIGWKWDGATNLEELQDSMRERFMVRRLKSDVLTQLPEKRRVIIPLAGNRSVRKILKQELENFEKWAAGRDEDVYCEMPAFGDFAKKMQEIGLLMVEPAIEVIENELESLDKLVVMCYHNEVARRIAAAFPDSILINEDIPPARRLEKTLEFQNGSKKLLTGTIGCAGEGLTMTAAHVMLFVERNWEPGAMTQVEDRIHRRGQFDECLYKHLVLQNSLAERQVRILLTKQDKNDRILDIKNRG